MSKLYTITVTMLVEVTDIDAPQQVPQDVGLVADAVARHLQATLPRTYTMGGYRFLDESITATEEAS